MRRFSVLSGELTRGFLDHMPAVRVSNEYLPSFYHRNPRLGVFQESFSMSPFRTLGRKQALRSFSSISLESTPAAASSDAAPEPTLEEKVQELEKKYEERLKKYDDAVSKVDNLETELKNAKEEDKADIKEQLAQARKREDSALKDKEAALVTWNEAKKNVPKTEINVLTLVNDVRAEIPSNAKRSEKSKNLAAHGLGKKTLQRKEVLDMASNYLEVPPQYKESDDRLIYEVCAVWASPGSGKSHILDEVAQVATKVGIKTVLVTFNGGMEILESEIEDPSLALACRLMYRLFDFKYRFWHFQKAFYRTLEKKGQYCLPPSPASVVRAYRQFAKNNDGVICIGIDEVTKICNDPEKIPYFYNQITGIIDSDPLNRLIVSTLDSRPYLKGIFDQDSKKGGPRWSTESSNRPVTWLVLEPLQNVLPQLDPSEFKTLKHQNKRGFQWLVALCGGNPRFLSFLLEMAINPNNWKETFSQLFKRIIKFSPETNPSEDDIIWSLSCSLMGMPLDVSQYRHLVQDGWLITSANPSMQSIPSKISIFLLYRWVSNSSLLNADLRKFIGSLIIEGHDGSTSSFESFHARFEVVRMWAYVKVYGTREQSLTLKAWYGNGAIILGSGESLKLDLLPEPSEELKFETLPNQIWMQEIQESNKESLATTAAVPEQAGSNVMQGANKVILQEKVMYLVAPGQAGFDSVQIVQDAATKKKKFLFREKKYSRGSYGKDSTEQRVPLLLEDVAHKVSLIRKMLSAIKNDYPEATEEDMVLIIIAMRKVEPNHINWLRTKYESFVASRGKAMKKAAEKVLGRDKTQNISKWKEKREEELNSFKEFKGTVCIVDQESLLKFYGPTFADCGAFALVEFEEPRYK